MMGIRSRLMFWNTLRRLAASAMASRSPRWAGAPPPAPPTPLDSNSVNSLQTRRGGAWWGGAGARHVCHAQSVPWPRQRRGLVQRVRPGRGSSGSERAGCRPRRTSRRTRQPCCCAAWRRQPPRGHQPRARRRGGAAARRRDPGTAWPGLGVAEQGRASWTGSREAGLAVQRAAMRWESAKWMGGCQGDGGGCGAPLRVPWRRGRAGQGTEPHGSVPPSRCGAGCGQGHDRRGASGAQQRGPPPGFTPCHAAAACKERGCSGRERASDRCSTQVLKRPQCVSSPQSRGCPTRRACQGAYRGVQ